MNTIDTKELQTRLRDASVWVRHSGYSSAEPVGYERDTSPFEAADALAIRSIEVERLRSALAQCVPALEWADEIARRYEGSPGPVAAALLAAHDLLTPNVCLEPTPKAVGSKAGLGGG